MAGELPTLVISILGGMGTGTVGLVGFYFQHRYSENTKQISKTLADVEALIENCSKSACSAWAAPGETNSFDCAETICFLHEIGAYIGFVTDRVSNSKIRLNNALINFRVATSGDDFDVRGRQPEPDRKLDIRATAAELKITCRAVDFDRRSLHLPFKL